MCFIIQIPVELNDNVWLFIHMIFGKDLLILIYFRIFYTIILIYRWLTRRPKDNMGSTLLPQLKPTVVRGVLHSKCSLPFLLSSWLEYSLWLNWFIHVTLALQNRCCTSQAFNCFTSTYLCISPILLDTNILLLAASHR